MRKKFVVTVFLKQIFYIICFMFCFRNCTLQAGKPHKNKRLLIISDIYEKKIGGTEKVISELKVNLVKMGLTVFLLDFSKISTFIIPGTSGEAAPYPWRVKSEIAKIIKVFCPDYIFIVPLGIMSYMAGSYCFTNNIPFTIFYSVRMPELCKTLFSIPTCIMRYFVNPFLSKASNILVPTQSFRDELHKQGIKNVFAWPHGVDLQRFNVPTPDEKRLATQTCGLQAFERPFYLFVGHLSKAKNLDAFLNLNVPGTKIVVGDENVGFKLNDLRKKYPHVIFPGAKLGSDLLNYYKCADIFLFPSKADSFGLVLLEALASGLPIVGFNTCGPRDVVPRGCSVSYLADDDLELQKLAIKAWQDLEQGIVTPSKCRKYAEQFSWEAATEHLLEKLVQIDTQIVTTEKNVISASFLSRHSY